LLSGAIGGEFGHAADEKVAHATEIRGDRKADAERHLERERGELAPECCCGYRGGTGCCKGDSAGGVQVYAPTLITQDPRAAAVDTS
jgi:hypothetical protein